jgi:hypothetical protein
MRNSVFSAELLEEIDKTKEIANKLRFKKQELAKYKSSNLKK